MYDEKEDLKEFFSDVNNFYDLVNYSEAQRLFIEQSYEIAKMLKSNEKIELNNNEIQY